MTFHTTLTREQTYIVGSPLLNQLNFRATVRWRLPYLGYFTRNFRPSIIPTYRPHEFLRWDQYQRHLI